MAGDRTKTISVGESDDLVIREDEPLTWFEELYAASNPDGGGVPWANMTTHPLFAEWLAKHPLRGDGKRALVVGCGMGDDAMELSRRGFEVTAFDVSESAIRLCTARFPQAPVNFVQADLFNPPTSWARAFDFVLEIYTVQAVPPAYEERAMDRIAGFVAPGGQLLVAAEVREGPRSFEQGPPWLLTPEHVEAFAARELRVTDRVVGAPGERGGASYVTTFERA